MKVKTLLVAAVMFLALSAAAFAQATFSVGSIPVTTVTASGNAEKTGDITFTTIAGSGTIVLGTITISYGVPITVDVDAIKILPAPNVVTVIGPLDSKGHLIGSQGKIVLSVPAQGSAVTFTVTGVRVQIAGSSLSSLSASISSTGNAIVAGQTGVTVINSVAAGLAKIGINPDTDEADGVAELSAISPKSDTAMVFASENYLDAFGKIPGLAADGNDPTITTGVMLRLTFSSAPPAGISIVFPATAPSTGTNATAGWQLVDSAGAATTKTIKNDTTDLTVYYKLVSNSNPTAIDDISAPVQIVYNKDDATLPLPSGTITYVASLAPIKAAFNSDGSVASLPIPRFAAADVGTGELLVIAGSTTTLLVPFATTVTASAFNTGFAIANTTVDPSEEAIPQSGTLTFNMYAQQSGATAPKSYTYTTGATSPGTGLDASGNLPAGSTYTVLLSEILSAAGAPADFSGYVIIETNFTNAHAFTTISDFAGYTSGSNALVVTADRTGPEGLNN